MDADPLFQISTEEIPLSIERFEIIAQLGAGGMARVFVAVQRGALGSEKLVVVKQVRPELLSDSEFLAMFEDEARIALRLQHPNVVHSYEVIAARPNYCLTMEFLEGQTLLQVLRKIGRSAFPLDLHVWVLTQVLSGLHYAHELRDLDGTPFEIVHRDVSPSNVFITSSGEVKLLDFGIAKAAGAVSFTRQGVIKGKLGYAAPEQCLSRSTSGRTDIFSVGVMLWEAIAGRRLMSTEGGTAALQARVTDREPAIESVVPDVAPALAEVCRRCLAHEPAERFASALECKRVLESYLKERGATAGQVQLTLFMRACFESEFKELRGRIEAHVQEGRRTTAMHRLGFGAAPTLEVAELPTSVSNALLATPGRSKKPLIAAALAGVALAGFLGALSLGGSTPPPQPAASRAAESPRVPAAPIEKAPLPAAPEHVQISIVASPARAKLLLDGESVSNPLLRSVRPDGAEHELEVSARGYRTVQRTLRFSRDLEVSLVLIPEAAGRPSTFTPKAENVPARSAAPSAQPPTRETIGRSGPAQASTGATNSPQPGQDLKKQARTARPIDEKDPY